VNAQKQKLKAAGLLQEATFHPNVSRSEKIEFLASCDVLSVPARMSEAFGLYLIESLAAGTPVVQPDVCGFREIIEATGGGVVYKADAAQGLANALEPLLVDRRRLEPYRRQGLEAVQARYTDSAMALGVAQLTQRIVAK
jgi:glycosyltransferase involved in cell wall biosynthesis